MALRPFPCHGVQSHASYACCLIGDSPGDCSQGPVYSVCQLRECVTLQKPVFLCSFFSPREPLWRNVHGAAERLLPGQKVTIRKKQAQNWPPQRAWEPSAGGFALPAAVPSGLPLPSYTAFQTLALTLLRSQSHTSHCQLSYHLSVPACSGASTPPRAAVESSSSWELTYRRHSPSVAGLGFQRNLAVDPPLHKGTWETLRSVACGLLDSWLENPSCPVAGCGAQLPASFLHLEIPLLGNRRDELA